MANWRARAVASNNCRVATAAGFGRKALRVGRAMATRIPMMEMTTRSSIRVKALLARDAEGGVLIEGWGKFQAPSSKLQNPPRGGALWGLGLGISLELGAWALELACRWSSS